MEGQRPDPEKYFQVVGKLIAFLDRHARVPKQRSEKHNFQKHAGNHRTGCRGIVDFIGFDPGQ